jgi:hypothetical protein
MQLVELTALYASAPSNPELLSLISKVDDSAATADEAIRLWNTIIRVETVQSHRKSVIDANRT